MRLKNAVAEGYERVTLLAATLFNKTRCCVAGIDSRGKWVRPGVEGSLVGTYPRAFILPSTYLWSANQFIGGSLFQVDVQLDRSIGVAPPHVEDARLLPPGFRPSSQVTKEKDRIHFLHDHADNKLLPDVDSELDLADGLAQLSRSLFLAGPLGIQEASFGVMAGYRGAVSYRTRIAFKLPRRKGIMDLSCTDLRWRALGKAMGAEKEIVTLGGTDLCKRLSVREDEVYLAVGLTRASTERKYHAMVVGVHTLPDYFSVRVNGQARPIHVRQNHL